MMPSRTSNDMPGTEGMHAVILYFQHGRVQTDFGRVHTKHQHKASTAGHSAHKQCNTSTGEL
jgi:hypothetical protein